jgi:hypothetical protein
MPDNVFKFRRLKWGPPKRLPVLSDLPTESKKQRDTDPVALLLWGVILASLLIIGTYVVGDVQTALSGRF